MTTGARACAALTWLPVLLLAPAAPARGPAPRPEAKEAEQRRALQGLDENDSASDAEEAAPEAAPPANLIPDRHLVRKGESLWSICEDYFHDPWRWPKIWALNPEVTNPHWIFPGQTLRIGGMTQSVPGAAPDGAGKPAGGPTRLAPAVSRALGNGALREVGFVDSQELAFAGTINGSPEEKILLASGDQAYIEFSQDRPPKVGQRFTIYQVDRDHPVRDEGSSAVLGYLVRMFGDVTIDVPPSPRIASGTLRDLVQPVERGYRVGPVFRQFKTITPRPNAVGTTARVIAAVQPNILIAEGMFVVLNRGRRDGVELGNRLRILRQGDGYRRQMDATDLNDERFPAEAVAEVIAVDVRDETSIAWVSGGNRAIRIGDLADMKKGY
ncbi:MAG TPA: LysM peptidoglycan-binding domain-containing protein [Polyangia bacterium]|nr:LysM peptidoglycan-binding domain-containing protein [Polyangia bacterium]